MASSSRSASSKSQDSSATVLAGSPQGPDTASAAADSFETAVNELDELVLKMESGELSLEQSLAAYQRGAQLVQYCQKTLSGVQKQVKILEAGLFKPFEDSELDADTGEDI